MEYTHSRLLRYSQAACRFILHTCIINMSGVASRLVPLIWIQVLYPRMLVHLMSLGSCLRMDLQ
jgi:hypothetical protein